MKYFIDTANLDQIREIASWGILDGVTTNPSLVAKEGDLDFKDAVISMCELVSEVSAQVTGTTAEEMISQGEEYASWHKNVVVKVPVTGSNGEWLKALSHFSSKGIKTNTTLIFSANQAILAAKAGATMISPFIGRLDDAGHDGMTVIAEIMNIWNEQGFETEVLVASTRTCRHIIDAAQLGADICTIPYSLFKKLADHPLSELGLEKFLADWEKTQN